MQRWKKKEEEVAKYVGRDPPKEMNQTLNRIVG